MENESRVGECDSLLLWFPAHVSAPGSEQPGGEEKEVASNRNLLRRFQLRWWCLSYKPGGKQKPVAIADLQVLFNVEVLTPDRTHKGCFLQGPRKPWIMEPLGSEQASQAQNFFLKKYFPPWAYKAFFFLTKIICLKSYFRFRISDALHASLMHPTPGFN